MTGLFFIYVNKLQVLGDKLILKYFLIGKQDFAKVHFFNNKDVTLSNFLLHIVARFSARACAPEQRFYHRHLNVTRFHSSSNTRPL